jgi:hypothetical protein
MSNLLKTTEFSSCLHTDIGDPLDDDGPERHVPEFIHHMFRFSRAPFYSYLKSKVDNILDKVTDLRINFFYPLLCSECVVVYYESRKRELKVSASFFEKIKRKRNF